VSAIKNVIKKFPGILLLKDYLRKASNERFMREYGIAVEKLQQKHGVKPPLFSAIEIETINRCNGVCRFCPVNRHDDTREYRKMNDELFDRIIKNLQQLQYNGSLALYSNNEPFLDDRLESLAQKARNALPDAYIHITTNGTLLTLDKFKKIIPFLNHMHINSYGNGVKKHKNALRIYEYCNDNSKIMGKVSFYETDIKAVRTSRGGQAPNKKEIKSLSPVKCHLPWVQMVVRPTGEVSLCCNDGLGKYTLGNAGFQTLEEIWQSQAYIGVRRNLMSSRVNLELCKHCDSMQHTIPLANPLI